MEEKEQKSLISKNEIMALNEKLYSDFSIEELEIRLETDPLLLNNIFGLTSSSCDCKNDNCKHCSHITGCKELALCVCDGKSK